MARPMQGVPLIPTGDGRYVSIQDDGSTVIYDAAMNVVGGDDSPNPARAAAVRSGDNDAAIDAARDAISRENARRFNVTADQRADEIENAFRINMMNARTAQDAQRATAQYQRDQTQLARDRLAWDREYGQAGLGMRMVETAANLRGPENYFQASNLARGYAGMAGTPAFLGALRNNTSLAGFGAQAGAPDAESVGSIMSKLGGGPGASGATAATSDNYLSQIHGIAAQGAHRIGAGKWEQMSPTEQGLFLSGLEAPDAEGKAYDKDTFLSQLRQSRIGQGIAGSRAA